MVNNISKTKTALIGIVFLIIGGVLLATSITTIKNYNAKKERFIKTTSIVMDYEYDTEGLQAAIVEYKVDGKTYKKVSNVYSKIPKSIGTEISIMYNPDNPKDAIWTDDSTNIVLPIASGVLLLIGIVVIIGLVLRIKKEKEIASRPIQYVNKPLDTQMAASVYEKNNDKNIEML